MGVDIMRQTSGLSFAAKKGRVQSAINPRGREIGRARDEYKMVEDEEQRLAFELEQIRRKNEEMRMMLQQRELGDQPEDLG